MTLSPTSSFLETAKADAEAAAARSGVVVSKLEDMRTLTAVQRLYEDVWRTGPTGTPVTADLLRALAKSGNPVFGAFDGGELVGACFGFCSPPATGNVHSHIAGVRRLAQGRSVGLTLKLHQRAWAVGAGLKTMSWTFDPLIKRNAVFNLIKLGAEPVEYLDDFYGQMDDDVNRDDPSDRLLVRWWLDHPLPQRTESASGVNPTTAYSVPVPEDIETMRLQDPGRAAAWRRELRRELGGRMASGARVTGFDRTGHYLLSHDPLNA